MSPVIRDFVEAVNRKDPEALSALITSDHVWVDISGETVKGRHAALAKWRRLFAVLPTYAIDLSLFSVVDENVYLPGAAYPDHERSDEPRERTSCVWRTTPSGSALRMWRTLPFDRTSKALLSGADPRTERRG